MSILWFFLAAIDTRSYLQDVDLPHVSDFPLEIVIGDGVPGDFDDIVGEEDH